MNHNRKMQYTAKDITIFRAKSNQSKRSQGDGEEHKPLVAQFIEYKNRPLEIIETCGSQVKKNEFISGRYTLKNMDSSEEISYKNSLPYISNLAKKLNKVSLFTVPDPLFLTSPPHDFEKKEKFLMMPTEAFTDIKKYSSFTSKKREPKFVPYEPYKGCVKPIVPKFEKANAKRCEPAIEISAASLTMLDKENERKCCSSTNSDNSNDDHIISNKLKMMVMDFESERTVWEQKSIDLTQRNEHLEKELLVFQKEQLILQQQLSTQYQVNCELKKLLVASVGEDVQGRVQCLTEDKTRMATMIRKYSEKVDRDYEEKEKMSIQCDVWRSKFLASSLLIDELARWKGTLLQHLESAKEALKLMLGERDIAHHNLITSYRHSFQVREAFDPLHTESSGIALIDSCDIVSLAVASSNMAENIRDRLLGNLGRAIGSVDLKLPSETRTPGEKLALQILDEDLDSNCALVPYSATQGRAALMSRYHPNTKFEHLTVNCCHNCNGDIKVV